MIDFSAPTKTSQVAPSIETWNNQPAHLTAIEAAKHYGFSVFPLASDKRPPVIPGKFHENGDPKRLAWKKYQTEVARHYNISHWQQTYQPSAYALVTGKISNRVILDFDGEAGRATLQALGLQPHLRTGSGGYHIHFAHPGWHVPTLNSKSKRELGKRWPGLDIRADGGYAAFCGNNEKGQYIWLRDPEPDSLAILPDNLRDFLGLLYAPDDLVAKEQSRRRIGDACLDKYLQEAGFRGRDNACFDLVCQLRDNQFTQSEAETIALSFARAVHNTDQKGSYAPFTDSEAIAKVASAYSRGARDPWSPVENPKPPKPPNASASEAPKKDKEPPAEQRLMEIASVAKYLRTSSNELYARVPVKDHYETVSINERGAGFRRWLVYNYQKEFGSVPNSEALTKIMTGVQAIAENEGDLIKIYTRIATKNGRVYLDLANERWECIEISQDGWKVITCPPVYFRRTNSMLPLPIPQRDGNIHDLRRILNAKYDRDYMLIVAWLLGTLHPNGPYATLNLNGERGSAKSKATSILRSIVDPNGAPSRPAPRDEREAAIATENNMIIALDNLSDIPRWLSDLLCRIATGSGYAARELYSDANEKVFNARRPIIINGIEDGVIKEGDLLQRSILVTLQPPEKYLTEAQVDKLFEELHPSILGGLLTAASCALRNRDLIDISRPPRMADFAYWVTAAEPALEWETGAFLEAYTENQNDATSIIAESSPIAKAIMQFMTTTNQDRWEGSTEALHLALQSYDIYTKPHMAAANARSLSGKLKRIAGAMRVQGYRIEQPPRSKTGSRVILTVTGQDPTPENNKIGVAKSEKGVAKSEKGVANFEKGVAKSDVSSPITASIEPKNERVSENGVANVANLHPTSTTPLHSKNEKEKEERERTDRGRKFATPATLATPKTCDPDLPGKGLGKRCEICLQREAVSIWKGAKRYCGPCKEEEQARHE